MDIGNIIQKRRKELNITQELLAQKLIVSISNILNISLDDLMIY